MATIIVNSPEMENKQNFTLEMEGLTTKTSVNIPKETQ